VVVCGNNNPTQVQMKAIVRYQIATYSGEITVDCSPDDEKEAIISRAKRILRRQVGPFPIGYHRWKIVSRDLID